MGVDIYGYAEALVAGRWAFVGRMVPNPDREYDADEPELMPEQLFHSYHKELAAILTDSGNPIRSSEPYVPIVPRRGFPADLSPELAGWLSRYKIEEWHSGRQWFFPTWFTAREAAGFGWTKRIMRRRAYVAPQAAPLFAGCPRGFPWDHWPADVPVSYAGWSRDGIEVEWLETYAEIVPEFVGQVLPQFVRLGPPDQVRMVVVALW
ncbi:hypothetical protein [Zavarzinella formosa]|uniref:hypothetical protein n=1 Tax=Zavarzinella formosa TaxID=360055 RepID=UPI000303E6CB|nr:hypothetical protein [Zavarzinella formosa]